MCLDCQNSSKRKVMKVKVKHFKVKKSAGFSVEVETDRNNTEISESLSFLKNSNHLHCFRWQNLDFLIQFIQ